MSHTFEIRELEAVPTLGTRATCTHDQIGPTIATLFAKAGPVMQSSGLTMAGAPYCKYLDWRENDCDIEAGCPVEGDAPKEGEVFASELPACTAVMTVHEGPYEKLTETHSACHQWIAENGKQHAGACWEVYITDPHKEPDSSLWRTEVYYPING